MERKPADRNELAVDPSKTWVNGIFWIRDKKAITSSAGLLIGGALIQGCTFDRCGAATGLG
jgi:hypothetical protein